ncbi:NUMOD4 domain-containing protein [Vibrio lentus]
MEAWKPIESTGGRYSVSTLGRIKNNKTERIRKLNYNCKTGVIQCSLNWRVDGIRYNKSIAVGREVGRAFLPSFTEDGVVRYKDGNSSNPTLSNLYMGRKEDILREVNTSHYLITHPNGTEELVYGIEQWCKDNGKDRSKLLNKNRGTRSDSCWYGYKIEKLD